MFEQEMHNTSSIAMRLYRASIVIAFLLMVGRLYQLQVLKHNFYLAESNKNRSRTVVIAPKRGVIYDRIGKILARNRPSFEISLVPEYLPFDDPDTTVNEQAQEIERLLVVLRADSDESIAVRIAETMFRRLGRADYAQTVENIGITLPTRYVPGPTNANSVIDETLGIREASLVPVPDITIPLPLPGLVALVERSVGIGRQGSTSEAIPLLDLVDRIQAFEVAEESYDLPGVYLEQVPVRDYIYKELTSHILGFMGPIPAALAENYQERGYENLNEKVGLSGLEFSYQDELRGIPGSRQIDVDILGREVRTIGEVKQPIPGKSLYLAVDFRLQQAMHDALSTMMEEKDAPWVVTIAMNPQNGAILGMVSLPSFDNNVFTEKIGENYLEIQNDERRPLINYAIGGLYPPGSVFKMVTASAALAEGIIAPRDTIADNGPIFLPNRFFPNDLSQAQKFVSWNHDLGINHGPINMVQAIALSNDIYFYLIGGGFPPTQFEGLGDKRLSNWAETFGYGGPTGIDLPGEVWAPMPDDQWKRQTRAESWTTGDSYNASIGQGDVLVTPLQVLVATAAIANGGTLHQPQLVYQITDAEGELLRDFTPIVKRQLPLTPEVIQVIQQGMWTAVNSDFGTAIGARMPNYEVAGKTGTAEFCEVIELDNGEKDCRRDHEDNLPTHAWFVGYAPYENPIISVVTLVYDGGEGSESAVPITQNIINTYLNEINRIN